MNHTKEPWEARRDPSYYGLVSEVYAGDKFILSTGGVYSPSELEANTKRIVACVNACADVEDDRLSLGYVKGLEVENALLKAQLTWRPVSEKPEKDEMCTWQEDEDGLWHTDCHEIHQFFDGTPTENSYKFCPYCAKPLKEEKYNDQKE